MHFLTDVYGPRLTGSPNLKAAQDWVVKETTRVGTEERAPRAVDVRPSRLGQRDDCRVHAISPVKDSLVVEALAWTPGTNGAGDRAGRADRRRRRSRRRTCSTKFFDDNRAKVKGKIVMVGAPAAVPVTILHAAEAARRQRRARAVRSGQSASSRTSAAAVRRRRRIRTSFRPNQVAEQLDQFLVAAGAVGRINDAGREHGQIRAFNNRTFDVAKAVPTVVMRNEDYGRISRVARRRHARRSSS